ncbi:MAG: sensor histidine kinase N-terminal domain-containing protein [Proteobacteria bacterium]|nr:sensor histidine kinase N-terminal domain-containing protein [Pseudomonadota bacterium]
MRHPSLRRRLLWLVGLPVVVLWLAAGAWLAQRTAHETAEMFDRELQRTAASVLAMVAVLPDRASKIETVKTHRQQEDQRPEIVVRDRAGRLLLDASTLPAAPVAGDAPRFLSVREAGQSWRVYQRWDAGHRYWIQVAAPLHDREQLLAAHVSALLVPLAGLLLLLPLAIWIGLRSGLAPLRKVSQAIAAEPAKTPTLTRDDVPDELLQLTRALDELVANLDRALRRERRFTADAAHELRHPLAVLQLELDLAGVAPDDAARQQHLQRARDGLTRMQRMVAQLLTLSRVESLEQLADAKPVDLAALAREVVAEAGERAAPRGVTLALYADPAISVRGSAGLLEIALRNLVDNAIAHGKADGEVNVTLTRAGGAVELAVEDDGPGIPGDQAARVGERFVRGSRSSGSGLGLSIVEAIAALHGGEVVIGRAGGGGARVALRLSGIARSPPAL